MIINMYTARSIKPGDIGLYTVTVYIHEQKDQLYFALYRCAHPATPNQDAFVSEEGIPQGERIYGSDKELNVMAKLLFPVLLGVGAKPDPF